MRFNPPILLALLTGIPGLNAAEAVSSAPAAPAREVSIEQRVLARLGKEHLSRATHRIGRDGLRIVAWGRRIIEWPLTRENPPLKEAVPFKQPFEYSNGGCATDLDGDGIDEIVVARGRGQWGNDPDLFYFEETRDGWKEHRIAELGKGSIAPHDILPIAFKGTGGEQRQGVVMDIGRRQLIWFEKPQTPGGAWQKRRVASVNDPIPQQSGIVIGDIAGHGRPDIAWGMFWAECPADPIGEPWQLHRYGDWNDGGWGGMSKVALADMDGDGQVEIVAAEAEIPDSRLGIFHRVAGHPEQPWTCQQLEKGLYCPHSLIVTDLNHDGRLDIVVGEMTAGGWAFPIHPNPTIYGYINRGGAGFSQQPLAQGFGVHEMGLVKTGESQVLYAADEIQLFKFPDMETHVVAWFIK